MNLDRQKLPLLQKGWMERWSSRLLGVGDDRNEIELAIGVLARCMEKWPLGYCFCLAFRDPCLDRVNSIRLLILIIKRRQTIVNDQYS